MRSVENTLITFSWLDGPNGSSPRFWGPEITFRHTALGRTPLDEWSSRRRGLSTWQHTTLTMPPAGSEPQSQPASGHWDGLKL